MGIVVDGRDGIFFLLSSSCPEQVLSDCSPLFQGSRTLVMELWLATTRELALANEMNPNILYALQKDSLVKFSNSNALLGIIVL